MIRGQSTTAGNAAAANATADQGMGATAFGEGTAAIGNLNQEGFNKWQRDSTEFAPGGGFAQAEQQKEAAATEGGKGSTDDYLHNYLQRTGATPGTQSQVVASSEEAGRQNERDMAAMANQDELTRIAAMDQSAKDYEGTLQQVAGDYSGLYAPSISGAATNVGHQVEAAKTPSFWDTFGADIAGGVGAAAGAFAGGKAGCWIAAELWNGWFDPRTVLVRNWLNGEFRKSLFGSMVVGLYARIGKRTAGRIRRYPFLRRIFTPLFNLALKKAMTAKAGR